LVNGGRGVGHRVIAGWGQGEEQEGGDCRIFAWGKTTEGQKAKSPSAMGFSTAGVGLNGGHVVSLQALLPLGHGELDLLPFEQGAMAFATDRTEMYEHVRAALALNKAITLGIIEPLDGACLALSHYLYLQRAVFIVWRGLQASAQPSPKAEYKTAFMPEKDFLPAGYRPYRTSYAAIFTEKKAGQRMGSSCNG
jgi:hypothetical protein